MTDVEFIKRSIADLDKAMSKLPGLSNGKADRHAEEAYRAMEYARLDLVAALEEAQKTEKGGKK